MVDRYTKIILTVIAVCLVWICVRDIAIVGPAQASSGVQEVNIVGVAGHPFGLRDVSMRNVALPVQIK